MKTAPTNCCKAPKYCEHAQLTTCACKQPWQLGALSTPPQLPQIGHERQSLHACALLRLNTKRRLLPPRCWQPVRWQLLVRKGARLRLVCWPRLLHAWLARMRLQRKHVCLMTLSALCGAHLLQPQHASATCASITGCHASRLLVIAQIVNIRCTTEPERQATSYGCTLMRQHGDRNLLYILGTRQCTNVAMPLSSEQDIR